MKEYILQGILWRSSGFDSALSLWEPGFNPRQGTKIPQTAWHGQKNPNEQKDKTTTTKNTLKSKFSLCCYDEPLVLGAN